MHRALPILLLAAACTPNNLVLTSGSYVAFIADGSSLSLQKGEVVPEDFPIHYNVDCREGEDDIILPDPIKVCGAENWPPTNEVWAAQSGYKVVKEDLDPWRAEALITSEGDLQLAFHHRILGGADSRFIMSIDPDFGPTHCVQTAEGPVREPLDGDWIGEWSKELDWIQENKADYPGAFDHMEPYLDGRLFFMNAYSFQYDPRNPDGRDWDLPNEWTSGAAQGKFSEEDLFHRPTRYGDPRIYNALDVSGSTETQYLGIEANDLFWCDLEPGADPTTDPCMVVDQDTTTTPVEGLEQRVRRTQLETFVELDRLFTPDKDADPIFAYAPLGHLNYWRAADGLPAGFDGWGQLEYDYIVFSSDSVIEPGGHAKGAFTMVFDAGLSQTRVFVKGTFEIENIKKDHWVAPDLPEIKLGENGAELCSAASEEDAVGDI